jgi:hypothetical protein
MNTKQILAAVSVAAALTVIAPAYAGNLGGGFGGALSGGAGGMNRLGGLSGQGAFRGQGAAGGSLDKPNLHPASNAAKQGAASGKEAGGKAAGETTAAASKPVAANSAAQASSSKPATAPTSAAVQKPNPAASLGGAGEANTGVGNHSVAANGMGTIDAQHSSNATSVDVAGAGNASATRNPQ